MIDVEGGRLWAQWAGEGRAVVLVHAGIADARQWDPQWDALIAGTGSSATTLRGFGRAEIEHVRFSNRADLVAVMDAAGIERAVFVGCSRAGSIVVDTALEYPDRGLGRRLGLRRAVRVRAGRSTPEEEAAFAKGEALEEAKDWAALADHEVQIWVDGFGQPAGRAPASRATPSARMAYETNIQEKPYGEPIVLDPPGRRTARRAVGAGARDRRACSTSPGRSPAARLLARGARRRAADRAAGRRPHAQPREARVVHRDAARVPRRGRRGLGSARASCRPTSDDAVELRSG